MPSTQILCKAALKSKDWLNGISNVGALAGWSREGKILVWVDNGNSWTPLSNKGHMPNAATVLEEYRQIAMLIPRVWEKSIYLSCGHREIPGWTEMSSPSARELHEFIMETIRFFGAQPGND